MHAVLDLLDRYAGLGFLVSEKAPSIPPPAHLHLPASAQPTKTLVKSKDAADVWME